MNKENDMKKSFLTVICLLSVMALSACTNSDNGTAENNAVTLPMTDGKPVVIDEAETQEISENAEEAQSEDVTETEASDIDNAVSPAEYYISSLKGPTTMGMAKLMSDSENDLTANKYNVSIFGTADEIVAGVVSGSTDIANVPANLAAVLYNKTEGAIDVAAVNTLGVLYVVTSGEEINSVADLKGKVVYSTGKGTTPEYTLNYILEQNGLVPGEDVEVIDNIQFPLMGGAFEGGTGDYVTLFEPTASEFASSGRGHIVANVGLESGEVPYTTIMMSSKTIAEEPEFALSFVRAIYRAQQWVKTASDEEVARAMQPFFPDSSIETLSAVANSYRATDSWMYSPAMSEDAFTRLQDIIEAAGELSARVEFGSLVDNSFADKVMGE